jgi:hypothetical protein
MLVLTAILKGYVLCGADPSALKPRVYALVVSARRAAGSEGRFLPRALGQNARRGGRAQGPPDSPG